MIKMIIIDANELILGRVATYAAKKALLGETVAIVNVEKATITGKLDDILERQKRKRNMGAPLIGPYYPRAPERFVKRVIRGMLPYKKPRGREALARVKCYVGIPEEFAKEKLQTFDEMHVHKSPARFTTVERICKELGSKRSE